MQLSTHTRSVASNPATVPGRADWQAPDAGSVRKARAYAKLVLGGQEAGDRLLEEAIEHYNLYTSRGRSDTSCLVPLIQSMRMLLRLPDPPFDNTDHLYTRSLEAHFALPLDVREAAALSIACEMEVREIAKLMARSPSDVSAMLDQTWGSFMVLLSFCRTGG